MGTQVTKNISSVAERLKKKDFSETMRKISKQLVSGAVRKINGNITPADSYLTQAVKQGDRTLRDSGALMASIAPKNGKLWASAQTNLQYARINQKGGEITSKGKGLYIPAGAETRRLMRKYNAQRPGELIASMRNDGYSCFRTGKIFCARKKRGKTFALFIIKKSVRIPARPFLYIDSADEKLITRTVRKAVRDALSEKKS